MRSWRMRWPAGAPAPASMESGSASRSTSSASTATCCHCSAASRPCSIRTGSSTRARCCLLPAADWRRLRTAFDAGTLVDTGSVRLWFHDTGGEGEPIFFLGGWTAGHFQYDFVRPYLADYRLLTWEPRGPSDRPDPAAHSYDLDVLSDDLLDLLEAVGVQRVHLWAGGFGSYNALRFAARHPRPVEALVTYNDVWAGDPRMGYARIWEV